MNLSPYSIIIPVLKLEGNPWLEPLLESLCKQAHPPEAVHLIIGDKRQGRSINYGVSCSTTPYIATLDDDSQIDDPELFKKLVLAIESDKTIGMAGAACALPEWASNFQKKAMKEIPRRLFPVQKETLESDMVQHPCLLMPTELFKQIGGEDEDLIRGLDPVLRKKVRDAGKKVVIVKDTWVYHLVPDSFSALMRMYYRNGIGSGYAQRHYPERVLELTHGYDGGHFNEKRSLPFRVLRRISGTFLALVRGRILELCSSLCYSYGVLKEKSSPSSAAQAPVIKKREDKMADYPQAPFKLYHHKVWLG